tara:strand:- start:41 stop:241 length:201 start_codon:yes stop_codon:yes gene_type:complete
MKKQFTKYENEFKASSRFKVIKVPTFYYEVHDLSEDAPWEDHAARSNYWDTYEEAVEAKRKAEEEA